MSRSFSGKKQSAAAVRMPTALRRPVISRRQSRRMHQPATGHHLVEPFCRRPHCAVGTGDDFSEHLALHGDLLQAPFELFN